MQRNRWSSLEASLATVCAALLVTCFSLIAVCWMALHPPGVAEQVVMTGQMVITGGAVFTEELKNGSSLQFKSLAYDVQQLVTVAYSQGSLSNNFKTCQVLKFSEGSVVVTFDLWFNQPMVVQETEQELRAGLQSTGGGALLIDITSIHITVKEETTALPTTPAHTTRTTTRTTKTPTTIETSITTKTTPKTTTMTKTTATTKTATKSPTTTKTTTKIPDTIKTTTTTKTPTTAKTTTKTPKTTTMTKTTATTKTATKSPTTTKTTTKIPNTIKTTTTTKTPTTAKNLTTIKTTIKTPITTTKIPTTTTSNTTSVICPPLHTVCGDGLTCIPSVHFCDGVKNCPDGSDEDSSLCATACDGQFLLRGPTGFFHSANFPLPYNSSSRCRWILRVQEGYSVKIDFMVFETEEDSDTLSLYEGIGPTKQLLSVLSGSTSPGTMWLLSDQSTVEFSSDDYNNLPGFNASYSVANISNLSNEEKVNCSFEQGFCFWRQQPNDAGNWLRFNGPTFPPFTGPNADHTLGSMAGYYIVTPPGPGQRRFQIHSLPLTASTRPGCLRFWYHMFGEDVYQLRVLAVGPAAVGGELPVTVLFQKDGNYGDSWNYGQITFNVTAEIVVMFEALKAAGMRNDIALDDISLSRGPCGMGPPEPTAVPAPTTPPSVPQDCGGPFDLWEPNSTFSSPNYPQSYGNRANCLWTLNTREGWNIQLQFLDFDVEATYDVVEVRDGTGPHSELLGVFTGTERPAPQLISTTNQMTVRFYTDLSGQGRGFRANFTSGENLGSAEPCAADQYQCRSGDCIRGHGQCDGEVNCPDGSDESDCVHMIRLNGTSRVKVQFQASQYTVCSSLWTQHLSHLVCWYLGYRSGDTLLVPAHKEDAPFTSIILSADGKLQQNISETCGSGNVISLNCDNQPCGVPLISMETTRGQPPELTATDQPEQSGRDQSNNEIALGRVVGGVDAQRRAWPWVVSLYWRGRHVCGASLIDSQWLVTAAHCVYGKNLHVQFWTAVLGLHAHRHLNSSDVQRRHIDRVIIHRHYNRRTKQADIAMMHLHAPVTFTDSVQPVCLPQQEQEFEAGRKCVIAGWGRTAEQGSPSDVLQEAQVPLLSQVQCQNQLPEYNITASMVCAGLPEGGVDSCQGDSGGPLMCKEKEHWLLVGVTSFGLGCGRPLKPGVYTRTSHFTSWIANTKRSS
ncbi:enteropeptidase [Lampris incognitus]|uniref:enteropeptidase n=1 Tax=Lampris incognitus TaxID=2546036 RepID=UPI0024B4CAAE|nr:enteropeptidase [Lampris incognitus]